MRKMKYQMAFDRIDGYFITNADTDASWECIPVTANAQQPPIKLQSIPYVDGYDDLIGNIGDFVTSLDEQGYYDPEKTIYFRDQSEYLDALYGKSEDWKLIGIQIDDCEATLMFVYKDGFHSEPLFLTPIAGKSLKLLIEVPHCCSHTDKYLLYVSNCQFGNTISITEYEPWGYREICFKNCEYIPEHPDISGYFYVDITESKK